MIEFVHEPCIHLTVILTLYKMAISCSESINFAHGIILRVKFQYTFSNIIYHKSIINLACCIAADITVPIANVHDNNSSLVHNVDCCGRYHSSTL